jgi:hypothetical protein
LADCGVWSAVELCWQELDVVSVEPGWHSVIWTVPGLPEPEPPPASAVALAVHRRAKAPRNASG